MFLAEREKEREREREREGEREKDSIFDKIDSFQEERSLSM